jgi:formylglycine-generating enzyme required for sulfatase activity
MDNGTTDCNVSAAGTAVNTGSRANCKSAWGLFDMMGNINEWVAHWVDLDPTRRTCAPTGRPRLVSLAGTSVASADRVARVKTVFRARCFAGATNTA